MKNVYIPNLGEDKKIEDKFLPDYVDDVVEYDTSQDLPSKGVSGKLYIIRDTNSILRWDTTELAYVSIVSKEEISTLLSQKVNLTDVKHTPTENDKIITEQDIADIGGAEVKNGTDLVIAEGSGSPTIADLSLGAKVMVNESRSGEVYETYYLVEIRDSSVALIRDTYTTNLSPYGSADYENGYIDTYLNSTFYNLLPDNIQGVLAEDDVNCNIRGTNTYKIIPRKLFAPSKYEIDTSESKTEGTSAGCFLAGLKTATGQSADANARKGDYLLRTPYPDSSSNYYYCNSSGGFTYAQSGWVRPAMFVSKSAVITDLGNGTYRLDGMPTITYDGTIDKLQDGNDYYKFADQDARAEIAEKLPSVSSLADGDYNLKVSISGGVPTYSWESGGGHKS